MLTEWAGVRAQGREKKLKEKREESRKSFLDANNRTAETFVLKMLVKLHLNTNSFKQKRIISHHIIHLLTCNLDCLRSVGMKNTQCLNKFLKPNSPIFVSIKQIKNLQNKKTHCNSKFTESTGGVSREKKSRKYMAYPVQKEVPFIDILEYCKPKFFLVKKWNEIKITGKIKCTKRRGRYLPCELGHLWLQNHSVSEIDYAKTQSHSLKLPTEIENNQINQKKKWNGEWKKREKIRAQTRGIRSESRAVM